MNHSRTHWVGDLRQSWRLEIVNGTAGTGRTPSLDIRASRCGGFFPLTPALSLGERVNRSLRGEQSRPVGFPLRDARCSLSPRERVRVRGNGANYHPEYRTIPGTVELDECSKVFRNDYEFVTKTRMVLVVSAGVDADSFVACGDGERRQHNQQSDSNF